jgi:hypothetical protein
VTHRFFDPRLRVGRKVARQVHVSTTLPANMTHSKGAKMDHSMYGVMQAKKTE